MFRALRNRFTRKKVRNVSGREKEPLIPKNSTPESNNNRYTKLRKLTDTEILNKLDEIDIIKIELLKKVINDELTEQRRECAETEEFVRQLDKLNPYKSAVDQFKLDASMRDLFKRRHEQAMAAEERYHHVTRILRDSYKELYNKYKNEQ